MKRQFSILIFCSILLFSCDISNNYDYEIKLLTVALDYSNTDVPSLLGPINDAKAVSTAIEKNCENCQVNFNLESYYQIGYNHDSDTIKDNYYPSKNHIVSAIEKLKTTSYDNTINIIYFSGHSTDDGSWVLATTGIENSSSFNNKGYINENQLLSVEELYDLVKDIKGKVVFIVDSCFSGNFYQENEYSIKLEDFTFSKALNKYISQEKSEYENIYILCATEKDNTAHEPIFGSPDKIHGYFTKALIEGLGLIEGKFMPGTPPACKKGVISLDSLYSYIKSNQDIALYKNISPDYQYPQVAGGRFDLVLFSY